MRHARTIGPLAGLLLVAALVSPAAARAHGASNQALFSAGVIRPADVPSGWTASKQPDNGPKQYRGISDCRQLLSAINGVRGGGPRKLSPAFSDPASPNHLTTAQDTVYVLKSAAAATKIFDAVKAAPAGNCLAKVAVKAAGSQSRADVTDISSLVQGAGDDSFGYEITLRVTDQSGATVTAVFDLVGSRVGRAIVNFDFGNLDTRLPQAPAIVNAVVNRLGSA